MVNAGGGSVVHYILLSTGDVIIGKLVNEVVDGAAGPTTSRAEEVSQWVARHYANCGLT